MRNENMLSCPLLIKKRTAKDCRFVNHNKNNRTALAVHHFENEGYSFQFDRADVLDTGSFYDNLLFHVIFT